MKNASLFFDTFGQYNLITFESENCYNNKCNILKVLPLKSLSLPDSDHMLLTALVFASDSIQKILI